MIVSARDGPLCLITAGVPVTMFWTNAVCIHVAQCTQRETKMWQWTVECRYADCGLWNVHMHPGPAGNTMEVCTQCRTGSALDRNCLKKNSCRFDMLVKIRTSTSILDDVGGFALEDWSFVVCTF